MKRLIVAVLLLTGCAVHTVNQRDEADRVCREHVLKLTTGISALTGHDHLDRVDAGNYLISGSIVFVADDGARTTHTWSCGASIVGDRWIISADLS